MELLEYCLEEYHGIFHPHLSNNVSLGLEIKSTHIFVVEEFPLIELFFSLNIEIACMPFLIHSSLEAFRKL